MGNVACGINWSLLLDYIDTLTKWPVITLIIFLVAITRFREQLGELIRNTQEWSIFGNTVKTHRPQQVASITPEIHGLDESTIANLERDNNDPQFEADPNNQTALQMTRRYPIAIIKFYRQTADQLHFERTFRLIFGSQIRLLNEMLSKRPDEVTGLNEIAYYHQEHLSLAKDSKYSLDDYIKWLKSSQLILEESLNKFRITDIGIRFLDYIKTNMPDFWASKPL